VGPPRAGFLQTEHNKYSSVLQASPQVRSQIIGLGLGCHKLITHKYSSVLQDSPQVRSQIIGLGLGCHKLNTTTTDQQLRRKYYLEGMRGEAAHYPVSTANEDQLLPHRQTVRTATGEAGEPQVKINK
jgi:hypothetical protein